MSVLATMTIYMFVFYSLAVPDAPVIMSSLRMYEGMSLQSPGRLDTIFVAWQPVVSKRIADTSKYY